MDTVDVLVLFGMNRMDPADAARIKAIEDQWPVLRVLTVNDRPASKGDKDHVCGDFQVIAGSAVQKALQEELGTNQRVVGILDFFFHVHPYVRMRYGNWAKNALTLLSDCHFDYIIVPNDKHDHWESLLLQEPRLKVTKMPAGDNVLYQACAESGAQLDRVLKANRKISNDFSLNRYCKQLDPFLKIQI